MADAYIFRNVMLSLDGLLVSQTFNSFDLGLTRESLDLGALETIGHKSAKGDYMSSARLIEGWGTETEQRFMSHLADEEEETSFLALLRSDTRASPMDVPGNPAYFAISKTTEVPHKVEQGKVKRVSGTFMPSDGRQPNLGVTLFTSRARVPDPLTEADSPVTPPALEVGELVEGFELAGTIHCHSITGTGIVTIEVEVLSDVDDTFATPTVQYTIPLLFTNEDPAPGGAVLAPKAQSFVLDGDVTPIPSEPAWGIRVTITDDDAGGSGRVELSAAINLLPK
jgi:hypothetical protein